MVSGMGAMFCVIWVVLCYTCLGRVLGEVYLVFGMESDEGRGLVGIWWLRLGVDGRWVKRGILVQRISIQGNAPGIKKNE